MKTLLGTSSLFFCRVELTALLWNTVHAAPTNNLGKHHSDEGAVLPDGYKLSLCARVASQSASGMLVCTNHNDGPVLLTVSQVPDLSQFNPRLNKLPPQGKYLISLRKGHFVPSFPRPCSPLRSSTIQSFPRSDPSDLREQFGVLFECRSNFHKGNNTIRLAVMHHTLKSKRWVEVMVENNRENCDEPEDISEADSKNNEKPAGSIPHQIIQPLLSVEKSPKKLFANIDDYTAVQDGFQNSNKNKQDSINIGVDEPTKHSLPSGINFLGVENGGDHLKAGTNREMPVVDLGLQERHDCINERDPNCDFEEARGENN